MRGLTEIQSQYLVVPVASISLFEESKYVSKLTSEDVMMEEMERFWLELGGTWQP